MSRIPWQKYLMRLAILFAIALIALSGYIQYGLYFGIGETTPLASGKYDVINSWANITAPILNLAGFLMILVAFLQQGQNTADANAEHERQRFEDSFYQLLNLHNQNVDHIQHSFSNEKGNPENFFTHTRRFFERGRARELPPEKLKKKYKTYYEQNQHYIDHFIRHLIYILDYVYRARQLHKLGKRGQEIREDYLNILKAQLSTDELWLLFYHILIETEDDERDFMVSLKEEVRFFQRIEKILLQDRHGKTFPSLTERPPISLKERSLRERLRLLGRPFG
ncbi:MAG: putative phage abortive infection protein [Bacteroidota bacterium]